MEAWMEGRTNKRMERQMVGRIDKRTERCMKDIQRLHLMPMLPMMGALKDAYYTRALQYHLQCTVMVRKVVDNSMESIIR